MKIGYNKKFFENKNDLLKYVLENKSTSDIKAEIIKVYNRIIERIENSMSPSTNEEKMQYNKQIELIKKEIEGVKKNPMWYFFKTIKNENEIVTYHPVVFEINDIECIIYSSFTFQKLFPCPKNYQDKILYMDHFFPVRIVQWSPLVEEIERKKELLLSSGIGYIDTHIFMLHHVLGGIATNLDLIADLKINDSNIKRIPKKWEKIMSNIHKVKDKEFKVELIDYVWRVYLLNNGYYRPTESYESSIYSMAVRSIKSVS